MNRPEEYLANLPQRLLVAATRHGENSGDVEYALGDLQEILHAVFESVSPDVARAILTNARTVEVLEHPDFADIHDDLFDRGSGRWRGW